MPVGILCSQRLGPAGLSLPGRGGRYQGRRRASSLSPASLGLLQADGKSESWCWEGAAELTAWAGLAHSDKNASVWGCTMARGVFLPGAGCSTSHTHGEELGGDSSAPRACREPGLR